MPLSASETSQVSSLPLTESAFVPGSVPHPQEGSYSFSSYQPYTRAKLSKGRRSFSSRSLSAIAPWLVVMPGVSSWIGGNPLGSTGSDQRVQGQYEIPQNIQVQHCVETQEWSSGGNGQNSPNNYPFSSQTKFNLPLSSENLFLIARGPQSGGAVGITTSSAQAQGSVGFKVVAGYSQQDLRDSAKVCRVARGNGENGVGIFTPENTKTAGQLNFYTTITLPEVPAGSNRLPVRKLETDVPNTSHRVGDINNKVLFDSIALSGSNQPINVQSLSATTGLFRTSNSPINGNFNASNTLNLITSNSPITVSIGLQNNENGPGTKLVARTSNGPLRAAIGLASASGVKGTFDVTAKTSNGQLDVNFPVAPVDSRLQLVASTSNSPAHVSLPPTYEGSFTLSSTGFSPPSLNQHSPVDPSGRGRQRTVEHYQVGNGQLNGNVHWGGDRGQGTVSVRTSQGSPILDL